MATCIVGLSGGAVLYVSEETQEFTSIEIRQYHMDYQGDREGLTEDPYGVYEVVYPPKAVVEGASYYSLCRFLRTAEVQDGKTWWEQGIVAAGDDSGHDFSVFVSLVDAVEAARVDLSDRERYGDTRWEPRVNVIGHDGDPRGDAEANEVSGWSEGWVDANGEFIEGDYENDERLYGPTEEEYRQAKEAVKAEWDIAAANLPDGAGDALDAEINAAHQVIEAYERLHP